jgi:hypothetical protein
VIALVLGAVLAHPQAPPKWTLRHARSVLSSRPFAVVDETQADEPDYELVFMRVDALRLRHAFPSVARLLLGRRLIGRASTDGRDALRPPECRHLLVVGARQRHRRPFLAVPRGRAEDAVALVLKAFAGYASCPEQPDAWHQYSGSRDEYAVSSVRLDM